MRGAGRANGLLINPLPAAVDSRLLQLASRMPAIKPIDTRAYGRRFRSRLEARWAVFFTTLGLKWEYEPEGFEIDGQPYLPDFRVWTPQGQPIWYEIKPEHVDDDDKFARFSKAIEADHSVEMPRHRLLSGDPMSLSAKFHICPRCSFFIPRSNIYSSVKSSTVDIVCEKCDWEQPPQFSSLSEPDALLGCDWEFWKGLLIVRKEPHWRRHEKNYRRAFEAAISARFEHGQSPRF